MDKPKGTPDQDNTAWHDWLTYAAADFGSQVAALANFKMDRYTINWYSRHEVYVEMDFTAALPNGLTFRRTLAFDAPDTQLVKHRLVQEIADSLRTEWFRVATAESEEVE